MKTLRKVSVFALVIALCLSIGVIAVNAQYDPYADLSVLQQDQGSFEEIRRMDGEVEETWVSDDQTTSYRVWYTDETYTTQCDDEGYFERVPISSLSDEAVGEDLSPKEKTLSVLLKLMNAPDDISAPIGKSPATGDSNADLVTLSAICVLAAGSILVVYLKKRAQSKA